MGKSTLLQLLPQEGYQVEQAPASLGTLQPLTADIFEKYLSRWRALASRAGSWVIEGSPWGYLLQTGEALSPQQRQAAKTELAAL